MSWTRRQRAILGEMGLRLWLPDPPTPPAAVNDNEDTGHGRAAVANEKRTATAASGPSACPVPIRAAVISGARPEGVAQMDWSELRAAVSVCTACDLCRGRTNTVFGVGNQRAHWMIVGEAPGEQEDLRGEPFVGKSGQLLDNMLRAVRLTRSEAPPEQQVYIANTVKCRPAGNRNPEIAELAQCEPYLVRQIELVRPKIIVAMGRFAVQSLLRSNEPIGRLRGRVHRYQNVPLVVTYHPAYLLRNLEDKARAWDDLCLAVEVVNKTQGDDGD